ncbi:hypothetical protein C3747_37g1 [Trypanosoma cruzi]|uniref:Uncharacterized protein n=1 Tax=Trypanosoma cruzi TaxID=5693 RepID=A0A2V2X1A9_TRYCR|nr:hypothetical protein C3747_37g1 [Trypanosoma cruzi]
MNKSVGTASRADAFLQEYFDACNDEEKSEDEFDDESDQDSPNYWRSSRLSPLRGKARLSLHQRNSVQQALMSQESLSRRGRDAAAAASLLSRPFIATAEMRGGKTGSATVSLNNTMEGRPLRVSCLMPFVHSASPLMEVSSCLPLPEREGRRCGRCERELSLQRHGRQSLFSLRSLMEALLAGANEVARAQWLLQLLGGSLSREGVSVMEDAFTDYSQTCTGKRAYSLRRA